MIKKYIKNIEGRLHNLEERLYKLEKKFDNFDDKLEKVLKEISNLEIENENTRKFLNQELDNINSKNSVIDNKLFKLQYTNFEILHKNNKKRKILICGFFGAPNLGDELMLQTMLNYLTGKKNIDITVMLANNPDYNILDYYNINFIHYPQSQYDYESLANYYDKVVFAGGAHIDDSTYENKYINEMPFSTTLIELSMRFIKKHKECYWIGLSSNKELNNKKIINKLNYIIKNITYFSLRDTNSLKSLKKVINCAENIEITDDIIIGNKLLLEENKITKDFNNNLINIGLVLICSESELENNKLIVSTLLSYCKNNFVNFKINLIPFYDYLNNDYLNYNKIKELINDENINIIEYKNDYNQIMQLFKNQDYLICERYHAILLGTIMEKKILTIEYNIHRHYENKISYIFKKYSKEKNLIKISEINEELLLEKINYLFKKQKSNVFPQNTIKQSIIKLQNIAEKIIE